MVRVRGFTATTVDVGIMAVGRDSTGAIGTGVGTEIGTGMKIDSAMGANSMAKADGDGIVDSVGTRAFTTNVNSMVTAASAAGMDFTAAEGSTVAAPMVVAAGPTAAGLMVGGTGST